MLNSDILKDLDSLSEEEPIIEEEVGEDSNAGRGQIQGQKQELDGLGFNESVLLKDQKFLSHMNKVNQIMDEKIENNSTVSNPQEKQYIEKSNEYAQKITRQIAMIARHVKLLYSMRFPELESIVTKPALYCKAAFEIEKRLASGSSGEAQPPKLPFLTNIQNVSLSMSASSLQNGLQPSEKAKFTQLCQQAVLLHEHHNSLMIYLESSMQVVAPNLCQFVGSATASRLISAAGGIDKLGLMPACNVQVLGGHRAEQVGFGLMERNHTGIFGSMDIVKEAPKRFQMQLVRMLASNTVKCAKADMLGSKSNLGARFKEEMFERFQKVQEEGGLQRTEQPLPVPDLQPKKKRGGKRFRKQKQLYEMSDLRKNQNRMKFGEAEEQIGETGSGLGLLKAGMGKLKVNIKKQKLNVSKKMNSRMEKKSGMESTLDFGSKQGIELVNPDAVREKREKQGGTQSYFARESGFRTVLNNKFGGK